MKGRYDGKLYKDLLEQVRQEVGMWMIGIHDGCARALEEWLENPGYPGGEDDPANQLYSEEELEQAMPRGWHVDDGLPEGWRVIEGGAAGKPRKRRRKRRSPPEDTAS